MNHFKRGLRAGIPIGLGYLSVSFTFGIMAVSYGLHWWQAVLISMTTVTSAGQFAGIGVMLHPGQYIQMLISQVTINIRYAFMSISLSQKTDSRFRGISRWVLGFMMTDEIFAVASQESTVSRSFFAGLTVLPYLGWSLGTLKRCDLWHVHRHRSSGTEAIPACSAGSSDCSGAELRLFLYSAVGSGVQRYCHNRLRCIGSCHRRLVIPCEGG